MGKFSTKSRFVTRPYFKSETNLEQAIDELKEWAGKYCLEGVRVMVILQTPTRDRSGTVMLSDHGETRKTRLEMVSAAIDAITSNEADALHESE